MENFNPRGPLGPRPPARWHAWQSHWHFNPRGPLGPRLWAVPQDMGGGLFQSTRSSGTATLTCEHIGFPHDISIHAVLWDRDLVVEECFLHWHQISIHAVLWDRDVSTGSSNLPNVNFNPRGPLGPRLRPWRNVVDLVNISIHAVLWDRDLSTISKRSRLTYFNPRGPLGPRRVS